MIHTPIRTEYSASAVPDWNARHALKLDECPVAAPEGLLLSQKPVTLGCTIARSHAVYNPDDAEAHRRANTLLLRGRTLS